MAADDVARAVARVAMGSPVNGTVEVAGPEKFRLDELVRRELAALKDPREVITDPRARYVGIALTGSELIPGAEARLGKTRFEDWLQPRSPRRTDAEGWFSSRKKRMTSSKPMWALALRQPAPSRRRRLRSRRSCRKI